MPGGLHQQLLDLESDGCTALRLLLPDEDAVDLFAAEQYMVKMPISLCAQDPVLLERAAAGLLGPGRFMTVPGSGRGRSGAAGGEIRPDLAVIEKILAFFTRT